MSRKTEYLGALLLLVSGGVLGLISSSRVWGSGTSVSTLDPTTTEVTGNDLVPLASAVSLVALAAVLAVPALRHVGRRIAGGVLIMLGAGLAIVSWLTMLSLDQRISDWIETDPDSGGSVESVSSSSGWAFSLFVASLLIWAAGMFIAVRGPSWPGMGAKYERPAGRSANTSGTTGDDVADDRNGQSSAGGRDTWDTLDRGDDPTR